MEFRANSWALKKIPQSALLVAAKKMTAALLMPYLWYKTLA
jgi:hypothetical protein